MLGRLELGGGQGNVECGRVAAQLHAPPVVVVCELWMSAHAYMCHYSTVTTPFSILDDLWVVWFAAGPATGRSEKQLGPVCAPPRADRWADFARATISLSGNFLCTLD